MASEAAVLAQQQEVSMREISALADRIASWADSTATRDQPGLKADMLKIAKVVHGMSKCFNDYDRVII
jgi:hypothetical protein